MKSCLLVKSSALAAIAASALIAASCARPPQPAAPPAPAAAPAPEHGRFQIVVSSEGERGAVLFLIDTKEGMTWIYRPPVGPAFNGYWSDIPRVNMPQGIWERAISMLMQPPPAATNAAPPAAGTPGAPSTTPVPPTTR
jgi:hypothetical protein